MFVSSALLMNIKWFQFVHPSVEENREGHGIALILLEVIFGQNHCLLGYLGQF
jgi:hypothetical protein